MKTQKWGIYINFYILYNLKKLNEISKHMVHFNEVVFGEKNTHTLYWHMFRAGAVTCWLLL